MSKIYKVPKLALLFALLTFGFFAQAQEETSKEALNSVLNIEEEKDVPSTKSGEEDLLFKNHAISLGVGFPQFLSLHYATTISPKFQARIGFGWAQSTLSEIEFDIANDVKTLVSIEGVLLMPEILLDYHPFSNSFRLTGGLGYTANTEVSGIGRPQGDVVLTSDLTVNSSEFGFLSAGVNYNGLAPYLGLGFGRAVPSKKRVSVGLDLGVYYLSAPEAFITATNVFKRTEDEIDKFQDNVKDYRWLLNASFKFSIKLN